MVLVPRVQELRKCWRKGNESDVLFQRSVVTGYWFCYHCNVSDFSLFGYVLVIPELRQEMNRACRSNVPGIE